MLVFFNNLLRFSTAYTSSPLLLVDLGCININNYLPLFFRRMELIRHVVSTWL